MQKQLVMFRRHNASLAEVGWIDCTDDTTVHISDIDSRRTKPGRRWGRFDYLCANRLFATNNLLTVRPPGVREAKVITRIRLSSACEDTLPRVRLSLDGSSHNGVSSRWSRGDGCTNYRMHAGALHFFPGHFVATGTVRS